MCRQYVRFDLSFINEQERCRAVPRWCWDQHEDGKAANGQRVFVIPVMGVAERRCCESNEGRVFSNLRMSDEQERTGVGIWLE